MVDGAARFPDADKIIDIIRMNKFGFTPDQMSECHRRFWHHYPEDQFFRFFGYRVLLEELWDEIGFPAASTSLQMHQMTTGHREVYSMVLNHEVYFSMAMQDNLSMVIKLNDNAMKKFHTDFSRVNGLMHWYRRRARQKNLSAVDRVLRAVMKLIMNLPDNPAVWVVPDTENRLLSLQVIWKERHDQEALTFTITAPTEHIF